LARSLPKTRFLYYPFYFGLGGTIGFNGSQWLPWIHVTDLAGIFFHAITNDNVSGVLNGTAESATNYDFTKAFAGALCRPAIFPTPGFVMNLVFGSERAVHYCLPEDWFRLLQLVILSNVTV
jgi:NAD dependent epimerase/dehydratase family enzyme